MSRYSPHRPPPRARDLSARICIVGCFPGAAAVLAHQAHPCSRRALQRHVRMPRFGELLHEVLPVQARQLLERLQGLSVLRALRSEVVPVLFGQPRVRRRHLPLRRQRDGRAGRLHYVSLDGADEKGLQGEDEAGSPFLRAHDPAADLSLLPPPLLTLTVVVVGGGPMTHPPRVTPVIYRNCYWRRLTSPAGESSQGTPSPRGNSFTSTAAR